MRKFPASLLCLGTIFYLTPTLAQQPTTMRTSILESHEGMTIGVDPWTQPSRYKEKFTKKTPLSGGIVALRVSFRNTTDTSVKVDLRSIRLSLQLEEDNRQEIPSLNAEQVADTVLLKNNGKDPTTQRIPLPVPLSKSKGGRDKNWEAFRDECQNAGVPSGVVAAHSTVEGLLYFDLRGEVDLLQSARLYIPNLTTMGENRQLSYFDIDLGHSASN